MTQTFIIKLEDSDGQMVTFHRFNYKRLQTCINRLVKLYSDSMWRHIYERDMERTTRIVAHKTDYETTPDNEVWDISIDESRYMVKQYA